MCSIIVTPNDKTIKRLEHFMSTLFDPITIGDLPPGKQVVIQWQATIDAQNNQLIDNPVNTGTVSATNTLPAFPDANTNTVTTTLDSLTLGGTVWNDNGAGGPSTNVGNGIKEGSEPGVNSVQVALLAQRTLRPSDMVCRDCASRRPSPIPRRHHSE